MNRFTIKPVAALFAVLALAACEQEGRQEPVESSDGEARSIFRPEFQVEPIEELTTPSPLGTQILFPEGTTLTEEALAELATVIVSPQVTEGGAIVLRGHSDAGGSDEANMRASQERASAVREWLLDNGVSEDRITIIAFGEQNPVQPNALPDGTPYEEGRAANRRVEIEVAAKGTPAPEETRTLAETLASSDEDAESDTPSQ